MKKDKTLYVAFACVMVTMITGHFILYKNISNTNQKLAQVISDQKHIKTLFDETSNRKAMDHGDHFTGETTPSGPHHQKEDITGEVKRMIRKQLKGVDLADRNNPDDNDFSEKRDDQFAYEGSEDYQNCLNLIDNIYENQTLTEEDSDEMKGYIANLSKSERKRVVSELIRGLNSGQVKLDVPIHTIMDTL